MGWRDRYLTKDSMNFAEEPKVPQVKPTTRRNGGMTYTWGVEYRVRQSKIVRETYANDPTIRQRISDGVRQAFADDPTIRQRIGNAHRGRKRSAETCAKIGNVHRGKVVREETRAKIRAHQKGRKKGPLTAEQRAKIGDRHRGKIVSEATRRKQSESAKKRKRELNKTGKPIMTPNGVFPSVMEVSRVAGVTYSTVHYWMKKYPKHYYYIKDAK